MTAEEVMLIPESVRVRAPEQHCCFGPDASPQGGFMILDWMQPAAASTRQC